MPWGWNSDRQRARVPADPGQFNWPGALTGTPRPPVTAVVGENGWTQEDQEWWDSLPQPDPNDPSLHWGNVGVVTYTILPDGRIRYSNGQVGGTTPIPGTFPAGSHEAQAAQAATAASGVASSSPQDGTPTTGSYAEKPINKTRKLL